MYAISYSVLDQILHGALEAFQYAQNQYDELSKREIFYTLYGPEAYGIGAASPSHLVSTRERKLSPKTKRKAYTVYELDINYKLLCNRIVDAGAIDCSYYHFELNDVRYAVSFLGLNNQIYTNVIHCLKLENGRPLFYAEASPSMLYVEFYEPQLRNGTLKNMVTSCWYYPNRSVSERGIPLSRTAPIGEINSPVTVEFYEMVLPDIDFTQWFH